MTPIAAPLPLILDEVEVVGVERLSPAFVRVELGGACLADFGVDGPSWDQRIKLVFPGVPGGPLPRFASEDWYAEWLALPDQERGHMRTYTVREVRGEGAQCRLVVDIVVHDDGHGEPGPGCAWAAAARVGDRVVLIGPRRGQHYGGIEFQPGTAARLLLAGDETAAPAICAILEQLPRSARGAAFIEVPAPGDVLEVAHPAGVEVVWLPRRGAGLGALLHPAVLSHLGTDAPEPPAIDEVDPDLWETPTYSSSGEPVDEAVRVNGHDRSAGSESMASGPRLDDLYAWIAGESGVVTALRRALVKDLGMDRRQVAFMGYWRRGVAMRG